MIFDVKITQSELNISSEIVSDKSLHFVVDFPIWIKGEKGDAFTYADFTPEQIEQLQQPAFEAATLANEATKKANTVSDKVIAIEGTVIKNEDQRITNENTRIENEQERSDGFSSAITLIGDKVKAAEKATTDATDSAKNAQEIASHPTYIGDDHYVYRWDLATKTYVKTDIYVKGNSGEDGKSAYQLAVEVGYKGSETQFSAEQKDIVNNSARLTAVEIKLSNTLNVTVTQVSSAFVTYAFTKENFDLVAMAVNNGAPIFVKMTDNRHTTFKTIDLSKVYPATWNVTLSQVEVSNPNVARGFYLNGVTPANRGCISDNSSMYINRGAKFDATTGLYELNTISDISEGEMADIYTKSASWKLLLDSSYLWAYSYARTLFNPNNTGYGTTYNITGLFMYGNTGSLSIINLGATEIRINSAYLAFYYCPILIKILTILDFNYIVNNSALSSIFTVCRLLEFVQIKNLKHNLSFVDSPNLKKECILYLIDNSANTTPITLTLHPTATERLTPEDIALASSKNITIA